MDDTTQIRPDDPGPKAKRAARRWRHARTPLEGWRLFSRWLSRTEPDEDTSDAPYWDTEMHDHAMWTGAKATQLLLFEKRHVMESFLPDGRGSTRAERWGVATHVVPFAPSPWDVKLVRQHARLVGGPIAFVGDLDPHAIHLFGSLRSGKLAGPDLAGRAIRIDWLGIKDTWLKRADRTERNTRARVVRMGWIEREYWQIVKRWIPGIETLVGSRSFALLEKGLALEVEGFLDVLPAELRSRLRGGAKSKPGSER